MSGEPIVAIVALLLGGTGLLLVAGFAWVKPGAALNVSFVFVVLAVTKFRMRDATASLSGAADMQVMFELAMYGAAAVCLLIAAVRLRWSRISPGALEGVLAVYVAWAVLSTAWSLTPVFTAVRAGQLALLWLLAAVAVRALGGTRVLRLLAVLIIAYVLVGVACGAAGLRGHDSPVLGGRFTWFAFAPVECGIYSGLALTLVLALLREKDVRWPRRARGAAWIAALALFIAQLATGSRGPLAASLAAGVVVAFFGRRPVWRWAAVAGIVVAAVAVPPLVESSLFGVTQRQGPLAEIVTRGQSADEVLGISGRSELWEDLAPVALARPVHGYGFQGSRPLVLGIADWAGYAHNGVLQTQLDLGVVGVVLLWPVLIVLATGWLIPGTAGAAGGTRLVASAVAAFFLVNAFTSEMPAGAPAFDILLVFTCAAALGRRRASVSRALPRQPLAARRAA